jgi:glycosyltransferase involved in cell wall biosynthesis
MRRPEVSVVVPTRSRWRLLARTLRGALAQDGVELEVVVVDDASTDETPTRLAALRDPRIRIVRNETPRGPAGARNAGIEAARGGWIAFLDDDDLWAPSKLTSQLGAAASRQASFVYGGAVVLDERRAVVHELDLPGVESLPVELLRRNVMPAGSSNVVARADVVRRLGGFDERLSHLADWDFWIRLANVARGAACPGTLVCYVEHPGNMLVTDSRGVKAEYAYLVAKHRSLADRYRVEFDDLWFSRVLAWGHREGGRRARAAWIDLTAGVRHRSRPEIESAIRTLVGERLLELGRLVRGRPRSARAPIVERGSARPAWLSLYR